MTTVIAGTAVLTALPPGWRVGPVHAADRPGLTALFAACSAETVRLRFFGRLRGWPREYLDSALAGRPEEHDAVVAYATGRAELLGLASLATALESGAGSGPGAGLGSGAGSGLGAGAGPGVGELGVLVGDAWQRQGVGTAMIELLLSRARARGVERVAASVLPDRTALLAALTRHLERDGGVRTREGLTGVYKLA
ncbi:GNAT family N-acetyltransferase [Streptomyces sp. NBC_01190]|uniref:GNAT family N-acetyltransferase n=1 Tax=Streptomyces sp. NBC_01190 TaxID=2903767 RepID=UPI00386EC5F3|nr:GNAT family N-acetyltransferase [Streptomyces sp. NBC_01190]